MTNLTIVNPDPHISIVIAMGMCGDTVEPVSALQLLRCRSSAEPEVRPLAPGAGYANFSPPCAGRVTSGLKLAAE